MKVKQYVRYRRGIGCAHVLLEGPHVVAPRKEFWIDEILQQAACRAGCHLLLATRSREVADLHRPVSYESEQVDSNVQRRAVAEYRETIADLLDAADLLDEGNGLDAPFLHLSLHGVKNREDADLGLITERGTSCGSSVADWLARRIRAWIDGRDGRGARLTRDQRRDEPSVLAVHRRGNADGYAGFGPRYHAARLEVAHWIRSDPEWRNDLTFLLAEIAGEFRGAFHPKPAA